MYYQGIKILNYNLLSTEPRVMKIEKNLIKSSFRTKRFCRAPIEDYSQNFVVCSFFC